ncbi:MAG: bifunctional diguanylate cyclase/phosphodiesterase [Chromatiales bacterium]
MLSADELSEEHTELNRILDGERLFPVYQAIVDLNSNRIVGHEALIRGPSDSPLHSPVALFASAEKHKQLKRAELLANKVQCDVFRSSGVTSKLFINASPAHVLDIASMIGSQEQELFAIAPENLVIEISELYPLHDYADIISAVQELQAIGVEFAIDDLGAGYSGLRSWSEIRPDYVKIDRHFISGIAGDRVKQDFVRSILDIAQRLNCQVVAEGIESREECMLVSQMGITFGQGYYLQRPIDRPVTLPRLPHAGCSYSRSAANKVSQPISELQLNAIDMDPNTSLHKVADIFIKTRETSVVITKDREPVGIVTRNDILELYGKRFGRELHAKKPISLFMKRRPVIFEKNTSIEEASRQLTDNSDFDNIKDFIIVDEYRRFLGVGKIKDLLRRITELQLRNARYANPLTQLPGNVPIYEKIDRLLEQQQNFIIVYCDLNDFKPYNDIYGYNRGDQVIRMLGVVLSDIVASTGDFVGHIGGDDFILIFESKNWQQTCDRILDNFSNEIVNFYTNEHVKAGGIESLDRRGNNSFFPLLSLSLGAVNPDHRYCPSHHEVAALATEAKREAKKHGGNHLYVSRRRGVQRPS